MLKDLLVRQGSGVAGGRWRIGSWYETLTGVLGRYGFPVTKLHLISYIAYGSDPTFAAEAVTVENIVNALSEPGSGRRNFRATKTVTATTPAEFRDELETLAVAPEHPFVTIIDSHGAGETPYQWHLSGYTGARDRVYIRDVANRGVTFKTDILFVIACYSELGLKHWRKIVGEECDIVLSRVEVTHADFTRLFTCFMLAAMGKPGRTRIDHETRRVIWDRAIQAYEIVEAGNRTDGLRKHERFEVHHGIYQNWNDPTIAAGTFTGARWITAPRKGFRGPARTRSGSCHRNDSTPSTEK